MRDKIEGKIKEGGEGRNVPVTTACPEAGKTKSCGTKNRAAQARSLREYGELLPYLACDLSIA